ncbi:MAG: GLPGLI family protein [Bacteroidetes bacterium]|nr:MAG: GLPGLI family protein [Bacteroidota bacterium]
MIRYKHFQIFFLAVIIITALNIKAFCLNYTVLDNIEMVVSYNLSFKPDSTDLDFILNEEFTLFIGSDVFQSRSTNSLIPVLYIKDNDIEGFANDLAQGKIPLTRFNAIHYINYPKGKITTIDKLAMDEFKYTIPMEIFSWTINPERKSIGSFQVQKAKLNFGGREWIAWFTTEIPISAGPYFFHGLPGLIVKISDTREHYVFELTHISKPEIFTKIEIPDKSFHAISKAEFLILRERFNRNPHANIMQSIEASGGSLIFDEPASAQRAADEAARRRNNPIELKAD